MKREDGEFPFWEWVGVLGAVTWAAYVYFGEKQDFDDHVAFIMSLGLLAFMALRRK